jgi:uncharacterized protein (TIGR00369 family)
MTGLEFASSLIGENAMPMAKQFSFRLVSVEYGRVVATAQPSVHHYNPFDIVQGGFAGSVLDMALGLVSVSVLDENMSVATTDLTVRYARPIRAHTGTLTATAHTIHVGKRIVIAEARLVDGGGVLYAIAQCTSLVSAA